MGTVLKLAPWITNDDAKRLKTAKDAFDAGLTAAEKARLSWNWLTTNGFDLDVLQLVLSNGYYGALALRNAGRRRVQDPCEPRVLHK
jgi:hypothetical protein